MQKIKIKIHQIRRSRLTLTSGGAFLGVLIAQIPGAIVGGLAAAGYEK